MWSDTEHLLHAAASEIRKTIVLIRADEPQLARIHTEQANIIIAAVETVDFELARAVGL